MRTANIFTITLGKMLYLLAFILIGYLLCRFRLLKDEAVQWLSRLVTTLLLAILVFNSFYSYFSVDKLQESLQYLALHLAGLVFMILFGYLLVKKQQLGGKCLGPWLAGCIFPNVGYIGLAVVQSVYAHPDFIKDQPAAILYSGMAIILTNLLLGSLAEPLIQYFAGVEQEEIPLRKLAFSPAVIGFLSGLALQLFKLPLPGAVHQGLVLAGKATAPLAMIIIGCKLFSCCLKEIFGDKKLYAICAVRLVIFPVIIYWLGSLVCANRTMLMILAIMLSCPPVSILTIYTGSCGGDDRWCTRAVFLSTLLSAITIPLVLLILG